MRIPFLALFAALSAAAFSQSRSGTYQGTPWAINDHLTLLWGGQPYTPVGTVVDGTPEAITQVAQAGIRDTVIDLPVNGAGWPQAIEALNASKMRYLIRLSSLAPLATGVAVEPQSYRIPGITQPRTITVRLPGAKSVFVVLASVRDGFVEKAERVKTNDGVLNYEANPQSSLEHVLLLYPETEGLEMPDFWEGLDRSRDELLSTLKKAKLGTGLRGIVDPLGRTMNLPGKEFHFVPTSPIFRMEFAALLEKRYRTIETAQRSWSMNGSAFSTSTDASKPMATFADLAKLVPLWSGTRGVSSLWDPTTDKVFGCDNKHSAIWKDIVDAVNEAGVRRFDRLVRAIREVANVPVVQEWSGWAAPYETVSSLDGVAIRASGSTPTAITDAGSRPASSVLRWGKTGWLVGTDINQGQDPARLPTTVEDLISLGARGVFVQAKTPEMMKAVVEENAKRSTDSTLANDSPTPVYFPENALNPAQAQRLPGGRWWLPSPADGDRIDFGPDFFGVRMRLAGTTSYSIWAKVPGRYRLRLTTPKLALFQTVDGTDPKPLVAKNGVDVSLTETPLIITGVDELPVPEAAINSLTLRFAELIKRANAARRDATEARIAFQQAATSVERTPGSAFVAMLGAYYDAEERLGDFTWIDAENPAETNFSEAIALPACTNGRALALRTTIPPDSAYYAEYNLPVRTTEEQQVWLAARIPQEQRRNVQMLIGGQTLLLQGDPVGAYGDGFAWYRLGSTRLAGGQTKLRLTVVAPDGADLAIDAILLTPTAFVPNGVTPPDAITLRK